MIYFSHSLLVLSVHDVRGDDARVAGLELFGLLVQIHVRRDELPLVVGAAITDYDLRWVLVWHHHCWLGQSTSESIRMIWLQRLLEHAGMQVISYFKLVLRQGRYFWQPLRIQINWLRCTISKCEAHVLSVLLEDLAAGRDLCVLEHGCGLWTLGIKLAHRLLFTFHLGHHDLFLLLFLLFKNFLWDCHLNLFFKYLYQKWENNWVNYDSIFMFLLV